MKVSRIPAGYWLLVGLGVVSIGLVGMLFIPPTAPCLTDGILQVRVADTVWELPENEAGGLTVKRRDGYGHVCEPRTGEIASDLLVFENIEPSRVQISVTPYGGGTRFTQRFEGRCSEQPFITVSGQDLGHQCNAYKSLDGTTVRITYYSVDWPLERWPELFQLVDRLLAEKRKL